MSAKSWTVGGRTLAYLIVTTTYTPLSRRWYSHGAALDNLGLQSITCESDHLLARSLACIHAHTRQVRCELSELRPMRWMRKAAHGHTDIWPAGTAHEPVPQSGRV